MGAKIPNIKLKEGATPITVSGRSFSGNCKEPMRFPTEERQKNGWYSQEANRIVREYGDRYELLKDGQVEGGN